MKTQIAFIHTSPAAIAPLAQFYTEAAPDLEFTNLLDDGILRFFRFGDEQAAEHRLIELIKIARHVYRAEVALVTCSSVSGEMRERLQRVFDFPVLKIDDPMARRAVAAGGRIGVAVTFPPTAETTGKLLRDAAAEAGRMVEIVTEVAPEAYHALLNGDQRKHDELLLALVKRLDEQDVDVIVLAQVSMARVLPQLGKQLKAPALTSLHTSLDAVRQALQETR
jgi:Asp/Glu/hydantoin racemase